MPIIATDTQRLSSWLKHEYEPSSGVCREVLPYADVSPTATVTGSVLDSTGALVGLANAADATYILMDDLTSGVYDIGGYSQVLVLARGPAKVGRESLVFAADITDAARNTVYEALAAKNIHADKQF